MPITRRTSIPSTISRSCNAATGKVRPNCAASRPTDEIGRAAVENKVTVHDLYATVLHLLGLDHWNLTYQYGGRDYRLTDVNGSVIRGILA